MSRIVTVFCVLLCATSAINASQAQAAIKTASLRDWVIVVDEKAKPCLHYAAEELQTFIHQATQQKLPIKFVLQGPTKNLFVGPSAPLAHSALKRVLSQEYREEQLRIVVEKDNIAIIGGHRGTLYGVYSFLEDHLGIRFLTAEVTHVPRIGPGHTIRLGDRTFTPPLEYRHYLKPEVISNPVFAVRRRQNSVSQNAPKSHQIGERLGGTVSGGVFLHNNFLLSASFADHPEYFSLRDGKRSTHQPCLTHPEVRRIVTGQILTNLDGFGIGSTIPLAQNDNGRPCLCPRCSNVQREGDPPGAIRLPDEVTGEQRKNQQNGPPSAVVIDFVNHVAETVTRERPDLWIGTEAYAYSVAPPRKTRVHPRVKVQVATYHCAVLFALDDPRSKINQEFNRQLTGWRRACDHILIWSYDMNPRELWLPFPNLLAQPRNIRSFVRNNGRGLFMQGGSKNTEFSDLRSYVITSLIWDPSQDANTLIDEFLTLYYGKAAGPIRDWIDLFHKQAIASGSESNINAPARSYGLDASLGEQGLRLFERAIEQADNEVIRNRVEKVSITALRLALEPAWWNAIEAPRRTRILKTTLDQERVKISREDLPRYRQMARQLFDLAARHKLGTYKEGGRTEMARKLVFDYLGIKADTDRKSSR